MVSELFLFLMPSKIGRVSRTDWVSSAGNMLMVSTVIVGTNVLYCSDLYLMV